MAEIKELWQMAKELVGEEDLTRRFRMWLTTIIRKERVKLSNTDSGTLYDSDVLWILADLNKRTGSRFGATDTAKHLITNLLKRGYTPEDFSRVHEVKTIQWLGDEKMEHCLRPSTLYRPSHFDEYLAQWWKMDRQKRELEEKRKLARTGKRQAASSVSEQRVVDTERKALISELMSKPWHAHDTWLDFMRWTVRFPDTESLGKYLMPKRLREMRKEPGMIMAVAKSQMPAKYEAEYTRIKEEVHHG
jgi:uncharacterized phage protein (TIGR02220 family)